MDTDLRSAGKHQILIKGAGDAKIAEGKTAYVGEKYVYLQVTGKSLSKVKIAGLSSSVQYTGHSFELAELFNKKDKALSAGAEEVTLYATVNGKKTALVRSTDGLTGDYTVTMTNSGNLGSFNVVFKGINGYTGTVKKKITVKQYDLGKDSKKRLSIVAADAEYSAAGAASEVTVTYDNGNGTVTLTEGIDYLLSYKNNKNSAASTAKKAPTVVVKGIGNFTGTNSKTTFNVTKADAAKLSLSVNDVKYNASAKKGYYLKTPKVVDDGATVATNKAQGVKIVGGYKYSYDNDVKLKNGLERKAGEPVLSGDKLMPGTVIRVSAKITCPASSNYFDNGETVLEGTYKVIEGKNDLSKCKVVILNNNKLSYSNGNQIYLIKGKDFKVTTKLGGKTVTLSTNDYEIVSIKNNKFLGTATVVLRGKGNYGGTKKFTFKIGAKSIS